MSSKNYDTFTGSNFHADNFTNNTEENNGGCAQFIILGIVILAVAVAAYVFFAPVVIETMLAQL